VVFSKNSTSWGSFFYEEGQDALRVTVKPRKHEYQEFLTYEFPERRPDQATAQLAWEDLSIPWTIKANVNDIYISRLRQELTSVPGFNSQAYAEAATFCVNENVNLDEALKWADAAISAPFIGQSNFDTLITKAQVLDKMGREAEAKTFYLDGIRHPATTVMQINALGRELLQEKKNDLAVEVFEYNAQRYSDAWPVQLGLARGYAARGENEKAKEHAAKALTQAPGDKERATVQALIDELPHNSTGGQ
jgi:tetratricopeptide (TPR) repeat protein